MVKSLAENIPDSEIVLIGDYKDDQKKMMPENVYFLGLARHDLLPVYVEYFNVGIIPFEISPITGATNPIKVYEYLAAGITVVSTPLPEIKSMPGVYVAEDVVSFVETVKKVLNRTTKIPNEFIKNETWENRVKNIVQSVIEK
jgi:glycosyltransferase involved in cell wall biosynthesis